MIGFLKGSVLFSDGQEVLIGTPSGVGYQVHFTSILAESAEIEIYISHVIREVSEELYGFQTLREKKLFEILTSVKGVGPKSAFTLIGAIGFDATVFAIQTESKKTLTKAPGIGPKAAAQIILDLCKKIEKVKMYSENYQMGVRFSHDQSEIFDSSQSKGLLHNELASEAIMACKELGFKEDKVGPIVERLIEENSISKSEQLVHLVLKEI